MTTDKEKERTLHHLGSMLKNMPELHDREYKVGLNLDENTFFQKLVSEELLVKGVRVEAANYFRGLLFLDYLTGVIEDDYEICDKLVKTSKKLRKAEKELDQQHREASYMQLGAVIMAVGQLTKERDYDVQAIKQRYDAKKADVDLAREADPYYSALALRVYDLVDEKRAVLLEKVTSRTELQAVVFTDCALEMLETPEYRDGVNDSLHAKDYFTATIIALKGLNEEVTEEKLEKLLWEG